MAISIKNHEDRITALEKYKATNSLITTGHISTDGTCNFVTNEINVTYNTLCNFTLPSYDAYVVTATMVTNPSGFGLSIHTSHEKSTSSILAMTQAESVAWVSVSGSYKGNLLSIRNTRRSGSSIITWYDKPLQPIWFTILKLYYNFSYNITREFYKVKFNKLKHYLCSHLQKFI